MSRITKPLHDLQIKFSGFGIHHAHGGSVGVFPRLDTAKFPHEVFRNHQHIRDTIQPSVYLLVIELINGVERLKLAPGVGIQFGKRHFFTHLRDNRFGTAVPVGIDWIHFLVALQEHIIHAPSVDGQAFNVLKLLESLQNPPHYIRKQHANVPRQVSIFLHNTVGKAIDLFRLQLFPLYPAHNMPPGGGADVDG